MHLILEMTYHFVVGVVSLLHYWALLLSTIQERDRRTTKASIMEHPAADHEDVISSITIDKEFKPGMNNKKDEVIIVGAGVAGAALAYALGKVSL